MKKKLRDAFRQWDEGNFDFTEETAKAGQMPARGDESGNETAAWKNLPVRSAVRSEVKLFNVLYPVFGAVLLISVIAFLILSVLQLPHFGSALTPANDGEVTKRYLSSGLTETGAVNIVAGVILDYRAFDTLGESHVLFTAAVAVMILLLQKKEEEESPADRSILRNDLVLRNTAKILVPFLMLFGIYIILNGHLGPGGGFSGGAVIGGALILYSASFGNRRLSTVLNFRSYRAVVILALSFYSVLKCYSFFCGANGLHTIFSTGTPGRILSAGMILPLNAAVGLVVACTMYGFYAIFTRGRI